MNESFWSYFLFVVAGHGAHWSSTSHFLCNTYLPCVLFYHSMCNEISKYDIHLWYDLVCYSVHMSYLLIASNWQIDHVLMPRLKNSHQDLNSSVVVSLLAQSESMLVRHLVEDS